MSTAVIGCSRVAAIFITVLPLVVVAAVENSVDENNNADFEEVVVLGKKLPGPDYDVKATQTTFDREAIEEIQPGSVFDVLKTVPGVELTGGPRANGISINIRGFSDNEDVLTIVDGAVKNFEKYRFGSVQLEPELLRELNVSRGPASVMQGSGAIGGVIEMETKDAADFLTGDDRFGAFIKLGYADSNEERLSIVSLYGRPATAWDVLLSATKRDSEDTELSTGDTLPLSASEPEALLAKAEWSQGSSMLGVSYTETSTQGREFFDTSAFSSSVNGEVFRETEDQTMASYFKYQPDTPWIDSQVSVAYTDTVVAERGLDSAGNLTERNWDYQYDIWSTRLHNTSTIDFSYNQSLEIQLGFQGLSEERQTVITNLAGSSSDSQLSQPSGISENWASYLQLGWQWSNLNITVGYRWDNNRTEVKQPETRALLAEAGQSDSITHKMGLVNYRIDYDLQSLPLSIFHSYVEGARYPKLDEYFIQGNFGRCRQDSSYGEVVVTELSGLKRETESNIATLNQQAVQDIADFEAQQNAEANELIAAQQFALVLYIEAVNNDTGLTPTEKANAIATAQAVADGVINGAIAAASNNITFRTNQILSNRDNDIAAQQSLYTNRLAFYGIEDTAIDFANLDFPTKTVLPEPYQSLGICGALYQPETVKNREWGISYESAKVFRSDDSVKVKLTYFETDVENVLESINSNPADPTSQPGKESTWGYELESSYIFGGWRFDLSYNRIRGELSGYRFAINPNASNAIDWFMLVHQVRDKLDLPADEFALTSRWISADLNWQLGMRASYKTSRDAFEFIGDSNFYSLKKQAPIREVDLFATWQPREETVVRLSINNATNTEYKLPGGYDDNSGEFILRNFNPKRTVKMSLTHYF